MAFLQASSSITALLLLSVGCGSGSSTASTNQAGASGAGVTAGTAGHANAAGGNTSSAGASNSTGGSATAGAANGGASSGGQTTSGGSTSGGGQTSTGGAAGSVATGGAAGATGSSGGTGSGGTTGACSSAVGSCTAPVVNVTSVNLGIPVTGYASQADTDPLPMAISAIPGGGSRLAWLGTDQNVHIAQLDCSDQLVGTPFSIPAQDLQDVYADDTGGVAMVVRNATNTGTDNCGGGMLCGGTSSQCQNTWLVRFDTAGNIVWQTQVTNLSSSLAGYDNGAIFTWKNYQHHGRIAFDGTNYAAYFAAAITVYRTGNSGCIDIHEGDRMQVVSSSGSVLTGHNSFPWGCSHSWTTRLTWDSGNKAFVMTCATDADNCAIERPDTGALLFQANCSGEFFNGDLINAPDGGYWSAWSDTNAIRLNHFTFTNVKGASVSNAGTSQHPHLVPYGASNMLLAWGSGTAMAAQVRDMTAATAVGTQLNIAVKDHAYQAFKPYPDGSVAYPAAGDTSTSVKIARVMPCK